MRVSVNKVRWLTDTFLVSDVRAHCYANGCFYLWQPLTDQEKSIMYCLDFKALLDCQKNFFLLVPQYNIWVSLCNNVVLCTESDTIRMFTNSLLKDIKKKFFSLTLWFESVGPWASFVTSQILYSEGGAILWCEKDSCTFSSLVKW